MSVDQKIFDKNYFLNVCLGSDEFKKSNGKRIDPKIQQRINQLRLTRNIHVLEIGCGRGDTALHMAKYVRKIDAIDYAIAGIRIANNIKKHFPQKIQRQTTFHIMNASRLKFPDNQFDLVVLIDVMDHITKQEQDQMMQEISRVLKKDGTLFIRTCTNKILLSYVYPYYTYPMNRFLTWIDKEIKGVSYDALPKDPRSIEQKIQHINESDFLSLQKLLKRHHFSSGITSEIGFLKEGHGWRTQIYNFVVTLYPLSLYFPLQILFTNAFICRARNHKPSR